MNTISTKKDTSIIFFALLGSIAYGSFVVASLERLYFLGSGDVNDLVIFFESLHLVREFTEAFYVFRYLYTVNLLFLPLNFIYNFVK